ncbi:MAG: hypothetical protein WC755_01285 [Candidatus Woesearchaeota archaeon]|jgi:hypothetical protein
MESFAKKLRSKIVHSKIFAQRTLGYVAIMNTVILLYLFLSDIKKYGIYIDIQKWFIPILLTGAVLLVFIGYLEDKLGFFEQENKAINERVPQTQEILKRLDRIEEKLSKKK